jgi:hypothetical protein
MQIVDSMSGVVLHQVSPGEIRERATGAGLGSKQRRVYQKRYLERNKRVPLSNAQQCRRYASPSHTERLES